MWWIKATDVFVWDNFNSFRDIFKGIKYTYREYAYRFATKTIYYIQML